MSSISMFHHKILIASFVRLIHCHLYEYLWSVGDIVYPTFRDATLAIGYLEDNQEWLHGLSEAVAEKMPYQLRQPALCNCFGLFANIPEEFKPQMSEDFARKFEEKDAAESIHRLDEVRVRMTEYKTLKYVAHYLAYIGKTLEVYGLTELCAYSDVSAEVDGLATESIVQQELNAYSQTDLEHVTEPIGHVNRNQPDVFDQVVRAVEHPVGGEKLYSLDGPGGTGNPFFWSKYLRMFDLGVKGAYRTFDVSYPSQTNRAFHMQSSWQCQNAKQIRNTSLIIWDEAHSMNRVFFKAVVRAVRDIMKNESEPSGGKVIVFSGDHRQILPVLKAATRVETIAA
ncbi:Helitron helicase [Phytophthora megakarya]|uniref:ATP-dependent DNA helicase n=1 Tax=Phytophthora megakarya TaxID=4795 RepID=A0A225V1P0_9STRA|nr:Helitron helicase [Phytophthora megakarya]